MAFPAPYARSLIIARYGGVIVVLVGALVLLGWVTGNTMMVQIRPEWTPMVPMTAVAFCLSGASLLAITAAMMRRATDESATAERWRKMAMAVAVVVILIGARRLALHLLGWPTSTDMLGFKPWQGPGQMALMTSAGFMLAGLALVLTSLRHFYQSAQWLAALVIFVGWIGLTLYFYGGDKTGVFFLMAMHTALLFAVLGMGVFYARPDGGFMVIWNDDTAGSVLVRRLFPAALGVPVVVGWLRLEGQRAGWYGLETGLTIFVMTNVLIFAGLVWHTASRLHGEDMGRRVAEEARARYVSIIESSDDAIIGKTLDGIITSWNPGAERTFGYTAAEMIGTSIKRIIPSNRQGEETEILAKITRGIHVRHFETARMKKDGGTVDISVTVSPIKDDTGRVIGASKVARDITERKKMETRMNQINVELEERVQDRTVQLEAANKELEAFSYSVSHDLRAPLRTVDGFSQAVLEDYGEQLPDEGRRYLQTIRKGAQQMGELIDDLLKFARLSRATMEVARVDMNRVVRTALGDLHCKPDDPRVELRCGNLPACGGDAALLRQVWVNLLSNALKYTGRRDKALIEIGSLAKDGETVYFVKDNGAGFDMRYAEKLFGVFQRLHRAEDYEGTGVGLAIVQRIVHRHGGRVWVEAEENCGATFYFTLQERKPS